MNQAQAKQIVAPWHNRGVEVDVHKGDITVYHDPDEPGHARAMDALKDIEKKLGASLEKKQTSGVHTILFFKDAPGDKGDWSSPSSGWHREGVTETLVAEVLRGKATRQVIGEFLALNECGAA